MKRVLIGSVLLLTAGSLFAASLPARGPVRPNALDVANLNIRNFVHREGIVCLNITNRGYFGNYGPGQSNPDPMADPCSDEWAPQGEYPCGSGQQYLYQSALWIGALVNDSGYAHPRVSVGYDGWFSVAEMFPGEGEENGIVQRSNIPGRLDCDGADIYDPQARANEEFVAEYSDTLMDPFWIEDDPIDGNHRPLGVEVTQSSMAWSSPEFDDFIVFEFRLHNIGTDSLKNVYLGLYVDGDVGLWNEPNHHLDDITGFLATDTLTGDTFNLAYIADNDGRATIDPEAPLLYPHVSGMYVLQAPQQDLKWSYNWWVSNGDADLDYGPAWAGGMAGTPVGDSAKYAVLSNGERDFDQIYVDDFEFVPPQLYHDPCTGTDTWHNWQTPDTPQGQDIANGFDTRYLISCGPLGIFDHVDPDGQCIYRLNPGEETTLTVAYVFGQYFHDPANPQPDPTEIDPSRFHFANLLHNARRARMMFAHDYAYQPPVPPPNFRPTSTLDGAVPLAWSPPEVGTVQGYDIFGYSLSEPNDTVHFNTQLIADTTFTVTGLGNGDQGILLLRTTDDSGLVSSFVDTLVRVGAPLPITGLAANLDSSVVHLSWNPCTDPLLTQYRVLRRSDHGDSTIFTTTAASYTDFSALIGRVYTYWLVAENSRNLTSYPSVPVTAIPWDQEHRILVIDDTDDLHGPVDTLRGGVSGDSVAAMYLRLLNASGQDYDILEQPDTDSLVFAFDTLAHYDVVIWNGEDNRNVVAPFQLIESREQIFRDYVAAGGRLMRAARKFLSGKLILGGGHIGGTNPWLRAFLDPLTFDSVYAAPAFSVNSPGMKFIGANAEDPGFPNVSIDTAKVHALRWGNQHLYFLPEIDIFWPNGVTYPLYRSVVLPEDSSGLANQPCAVIGHNEIMLAFPLYFLQEDQAQALLNASINALRTYEFEGVPKPHVSLPTSTTLEQNYPNPFNPATTLRFSLAKAGPVQLAIYNLLGQQVRVLVDQPMTEGLHQLIWDGEGASGQTLPSGVYLARLQAVDATRVVKLMLLR